MYLVCFYRVWCVLINAFLFYTLAFQNKQNAMQHYDFNAYASREVLYERQSPAHHALDGWRCDLCHERVRDPRTGGSRGGPRRKHESNEGLNVHS